MKKVFIYYFCFYYGSFRGEQLISLNILWLAFIRWSTQGVKCIR